MRLSITVATVALLLASPLAHAVTVTYSSFPPNPGVMPGGGFQYTQGSTFAQPTGPRMWVNGVYGGVREFRPTQVATVLGPAGVALGAAATTRIGFGAGVQAIGRCLLGGGPICAVGTAAAVAYAQYRARQPASPNAYENPSAWSPTGVVDYDPGTAEVPDTAWCLANPPAVAGQCASTPSGAAEIHRTWYHNAKGTCANGTRTATRVVMLDATSWRLQVQSCPPSTAWEDGPYGGASSQSVNSCPASIDPLDPAVSIPKGSPKVDGRCPTARYRHIPKTLPEIQEIVEANPPPFPDTTWRDALRDSIDTGGQTVPGDMTISGPASQTGPSTTTTTTAPNGTTTTSVESPVYNYTYNDNKVTWNITNTSTVNNGSGTTTTTTNAPAPEIKTCGYPGGPKCAIDETGTPTQPTMGPANTQLETRTTGVIEKINQPSTPLPWLWGGVSLPSGTCANMEIEGPIAAIASRTFNICTQPWVAWWRLAWAWIAGLGVVGYGWRRFNDTVERT